MSRQLKRRNNAQSVSRPIPKQINGTLPRSIPLLSYPSSDKGNALFVGRAGCFSEIHRNDPQHALGDLSFVVQNIEGEANTRDSIPHVDAQTLCYRYMLNNVTRNDPSLAHIKQQWRGAVVAYALSPLLIAMHHVNQAKKDGQPVTQKLQPVLSWLHVGAEELVENREDELGQVIRGGYPASKANLRNISWQFLALLENDVQIPLLSYSRQLLAVPSASLANIPNASAIFPWLTGNEFTDPLKMLSAETLLLLADWAQTMLLQPNLLAAYALEQYRQELLNQAVWVQENQPFLEIWKTVIQALLLRDWVETGILVVSTKERMRECDLSEALRYAPIDNGPLRDEASIVQAYPYAIFLHNRFLGFLNRKNALWLYDPGYFATSPQYQRLSQVLSQALRTDTGIRVAYQHQVQYLLHNFPFNAAENRALSEDLSRENATVRCVVSPVLHKMQPGERGILDEPFSMMSAVCRYYDGDGTMFTPSITVYKDRTSPIYVEKTNNEWGTIQGHTGQTSTDCALLPLSACGATIIRNAYRMRYTVKMVLKYDESGEVIGLNLQMKNASILYEWKYNYSSIAIRQGDNSNMPSVCYWPNGASHANDIPWSLYYTYIHYHEGFDPVRYSSMVYDLNGKRMSDARNNTIEQINTKGVHFTWETHETERFPSFCTMYENGQSLGCILFRQPDLFPPITQNAALSVDFGTTSTTAAVILDTGASQTINTAIFSDSTLKWEMVGDLGQSWSVEQYIADGLNTSAGLGGSGAFYTAMARFDTLANNDDDSGSSDTPVESKLFRNGHIYFFGEGVHMENPMGNQRFVGLKMKSYDPAHPWGVSNVEMFLRQVLEMYALYCRQKGARIEKILFAYPMAFSKEKREQFQLFVSKVLRTVAPRTGMEPCMLAFYNESQAVSAYFSLIPKLAAANAEEGCVTLDIGGGTVDYSFCALNAGRPSNARFDSCQLGGQRLVGEYAYQCAVRLNQGKSRALDWFHEGFNSISAKRSPNDVSDIHTFLEDLIKLYRRPKSEFIFCVDHFISLRPAIFKDVLKTPAFQAQYKYILFELTLLLWFGYYLGLQGCAGNVGNVLRVYSAGNGSNLLKVIDDADYEKLMKMFVSIGGKALDVVPSVAPKREVVEGLLRMDSYSPDTVNLPCKDPEPQQIWASFLLMVQEFVTAFPNDNDVVTPYLTSILNDQQTQEDAKKRFLDNNKDLTQLCTHLPNICDIVVLEMLEKL